MTKANTFINMSFEVVIISLKHVYRHFIYCFSINNLSVDAKDTKMLKECNKINQHTKYKTKYKHSNNKFVVYKTLFPITIL